VAVGTEQSEVAERVVRAIAVDVIEFEGRRLSLPFLDPATLAARLFQAVVEEALLEVARMYDAARHELLICPASMSCH
jgi:hypothetical protein